MVITKLYIHLTLDSHLPLQKQYNEYYMLIRNISSHRYSSSVTTFPGYITKKKLNNDYVSHLKYSVNAIFCFVLFSRLYQGHMARVET